MGISLANVIGWAITVAIFVTVQIVALIKTNAKQSVMNQQFQESIKLLTKDDNELLEKINDSLEWGRSIVRERELFNAQTYVRQDVYSQCHRELKDAIASLLDLKFPERFARIETELAHIRAILEKQ